MDIQSLLAGRVTHLKASAIREIFKILNKKDIISLAGGAPAPETFPGDALGEIAQELLSKQFATSLQYGTTEGYQPLIDIVNARMAKVESLKDFDQTIIVSGGQQGIDLAIKSLVNDGEGVIVEQPSFIGTLNSARSYNARLFGVNVLDDGMDLDAVEAILKKESIKLIYTIPTFQNPSGITMSTQKRKRLLQLATQYNVLILEDNPYGELRFKGEPTPTLKSLDTEGRVIYVGSFSKILSPGMRLGWVTAHAEIVDRIVVVKQVNDVHTPILNQMMAAEFCTRYSMDEHIESIKELYKKRCEFIIECLDKYMPDYVKHTNPEGGLFIYCTLPEGFNTMELLKRSMEKKVAFVPGHTFMIDIDTPANTFRLNYSNVPEEKIEQGVWLIAEAIKEYKNG